MEFEVLFFQMSNSDGSFFLIFLCTGGATLVFEVELIKIDRESRSDL